VCHAAGRVAENASDVPDVLAPDLVCVFCGINPGRVSAAAAAHFANPRNDFWRLLHDAGFTPRFFSPAEQFELLQLGYGITNAAYRTTPGSGDLRSGDFDAIRLERVARDLKPRAIAFVGKEAYRGVFGERAELGPQIRTLEDSGLYVLPSTSPANAAVPYETRLGSFRALRSWLEPVPRPAARALVLDASGRILLLRWQNSASGEVWWILPGGRIDEGETAELAIRRELVEELGLEADPGPRIGTRERVYPLDGVIVEQHDSFFVVRVDSHDPVARVDLVAEGVHGHRWWTPAELASTVERIAPADLAELLASV
jgi:TDG/mug DNA glycosylase family protein